MTADELFRMPAEDAVIELVDGEIRRSPLHGAAHGLVAANVCGSLVGFIEAHKLGVATAPGTGYIIRRNPDTVRAPDVGFVRKDRWIETEEFFPGAPDLAVEIISPRELFTDVNEKIVDWLRAGVQRVIVVDLGNQSAIIHRSPTHAVRIDIDGTLDGGDVVPGWQLPMRDLFVA